jgi:hypothetical protein
MGGPNTLWTRLLNPTFLFTCKNDVYKRKRFFHDTAMLWTLAHVTFIAPIHGEHYKRVYPISQAVDSRRSMGQLAKPVDSRSVSNMKLASGCHHGKPIGTVGENSHPLFEGHGVVGHTSKWAHSTRHVKMHLTCESQVSTSCGRPSNGRSKYLVNTTLKSIFFIYM